MPGSSERKDNNKPFSYSDYAMPPVRSLSTSSKVSATREQMLAMGYQDEDGWLTQLITDKRGNLEEVLEVLAPVDVGKKN